jgi:hypothetical protein
MILLAVPVHPPLSACNTVVAVSDCLAVPHKEHAILQEPLVLFSRRFTIRPSMIALVTKEEMVANQGLHSHARESHVDETRAEEKETSTQVTVK